VLAAPDELSLGWLCDDADAAGFRVVRFHEPDLGGALTAAALEPAAARLVARFPLALSQTRSPSREPFRSPSSGFSARLRAAFLLVFERLFCSPSSGFLCSPSRRRGGEKMTTPTDAADLRAQLVELAAERDALRAQLDGDLPAATRWLQRKAWRQAAALDALNHRVVAQRFVLRSLDELGRSLTAAEHRAARARVTNAQLRDRIEDPDAA
jgi:hypothetical protein